MGRMEAACGGAHQGWRDRDAGGSDDYAGGVDLQELHAPVWPSARWSWCFPGLRHTTTPALTCCNGEAYRRQNQDALRVSTQHFRGWLIKGAVHAVAHSSYQESSSQQLRQRLTWGLNSRPVGTTRSPAFAFNLVTPLNMDDIGVLSHPATSRTWAAHQLGQLRPLMGLSALHLATG